MITVGIRDLKNQLSQYLQYVKQGEKILITEHKRIIAEIQLPQQNDLNTNIETELAKLAALGKIIKSKRNTPLSPHTSTTMDLDWISVYQENRAD
jgi:antitoxin (DNA-binding transcriptional repressor) of toxin-antitoxin stability system